MTTRTVLKVVATSLALVPTALVQADQGDDEGRTPMARLEFPRSPGGEFTLIEGHLEVPDDGYVPAPRTGRPTTPAVHWTRNGHVSVQVNVDSAGNNIAGDAANEPSIAVDPTNPTRMAIGWRQFDTITNNFRQAGWGYTSDGGYTWTFPGVIEPGVFRSDPVLGATTQGTFLYNSLTASGMDFWCNVYRSTDGGASWDAGVYSLWWG